MMIKSFFGMIMKNFWKKKLAPLKLIFCLQSAAFFALCPYMKLYKRELGIDGEETATTEAITCVIVIIVPPVAGLLADRIGNFKLLLSLFSTLGGVGALLLLSVPVGQSAVLHPPNILLTTFGCNSDGNLVFETDPYYSCDTISNVRTMLTKESCGYACALGSLNESYIEDILHSHNYRLIRHNTESQSDIEDDLSETLQLENITIYSNTAVRQISKDVFFFPIKRSTEPDVMFLTNFKAMNKTDEHRRYLAKDFECTSNADEVVKTARIEVALIDTFVKLDECNQCCEYLAPRRDVCSNVKTIVDYNSKLYSGVRIFTGILNTITSTMFDGAVIAILREEKADYGLQKIYGVIGGMISSPLSGMLIDYVSGDKGYLDFRPVFYLYAALKVLQGVLMLTIDLDFKKPTPNITNVMTNALRNVEMVALLIACLALGIIMGSIKSFTYWSVEGLQATKSLIGMCIISGAIAGFVSLLMSGQIINAIGHSRFIFVSFVLCTVTLSGYSLIYDPWLCPIFETLESATTSLSSVAVVTYAGKLSTWMTDGSIQGLLKSLYHGVGNGSGSMISGYLVKVVDIRSTYQIFAVMALLMSLGYLWFTSCYSSKKDRDEKIDEKENKNSYSKSNHERIDISK